MINIPLLSGDEMLETLQNKNGGRYPLHCQWEITCRCNLKCVMCYTDCFNTQEHIARELSTAEIFRIMDEMKEAGLIELVLTGGEPMSRPDFKEIYCRAIKSGFLTTVFTNGTFISEQWIQIWKQFPPQRIEISLHGKGEKTFDRITGMSGSYKRVKEAIDLVLEAKLPLTLKATALDLNYEEILDLKKTVHSLPNVDFHLGTRIRPLANGDESSLQFQVDDEKLAQLFNQDLELENEFKQKKIKDDQKRNSCHAGKMKFHIDAYGKLQLCSSNRREGYDLRKGNFAEGFYKHLPHFPCPGKRVETVQIKRGTNHVAV
jgi:MoaA/NifB/PqqE/SkfB family radical SAM enzyme